jgi:hypothetical protein
MTTEPVSTVGAETGAPGSLTWTVFDADPTLFTATIIDVPNDILQLDLALNAVDGSDDILLVLTDSDGFTDQQWVTVDVHSFPYIISTVPFNGQTAVGISQSIIVVFDQPMITGTVGFTCSPNPGGLTISWNAAQTTMYIEHTRFTPDATYTCEITSGTSLTGRDLKPGAPNPWTFTTQIYVSGAQDGDGAAEGDISTSDDQAPSYSDSEDFMGPYGALIALLIFLGLGVVFIFFLTSRRKKEEE